MKPSGPSIRRQPMRSIAAALFTLLAAGTAGVHAQDYPSRPMRIIVPYGAGGSSDAPMRVIAAELSKQMGQQMLVENRPGQGAMLGSEVAAKAPADGYTLLLASNPNAISATLYSKLSFDPIDDFAPISLLGREQGVLLVHPSFPAKNIREFISVVREQPGKIDYGSSGNGSAQHLFTAMFASMAGLKMVHVPYKGSPQVTADLLGGQIKVALPGLAQMMSPIRDGRLRPMAVTGAARSSLLPDVPTMAESGLKGYEAYVWMGMLAPRGTPAPIIDRLNREMLASLKTPGVRSFMSNAAIEQIGSTPAEFGAFYRAERDLWARIIREVGAKIE
ncbi:MAG: tripartite tricarboxylate transporter substrate binding protein [Proteobacteria bacterium]|jgi:tripartite-type tricarboxylate transporter receptor subunit TctC|nr:tripartite tricarboxylate transporter substrate binding protein [Pseudomonadota bacterium]